VLPYFPDREIPHTAPKRCHTIPQAVSILISGFQALSKSAETQCAMGSFSWTGMSSKSKYAIGMSSMYFNTAVTIQQSDLNRSIKIPPNIQCSNRTRHSGKHFRAGNAATGYRALYANTTGNDNTATGMKHVRQHHGERMSLQASAHCIQLQGYQQCCGGKDRCTITLREGSMLPLASGALY